MPTAHAKQRPAIHYVVAEMCRGALLKCAEVQRGAEHVERSGTQLGGVLNSPHGKPLTGNKVVIDYNQAMVLGMLKQAHLVKHHVAWPPFL